MSGLLFFKTKDLNKITEFYTKRIGARIWLGQPDCTVFKHGNFLFGFCQKDDQPADTNGVLTFFFESDIQVDDRYDDLQDIATTEPAYNDKYRVYQFFAKDPEGRTLEFQQFDHPLPVYYSADELLTRRRSVRAYADQPLSDDLYDAILNLARFGPTAHNKQSYYFKRINDRSVISKLAAMGGEMYAPLERAPEAVAIAADPNLSTQHVQDGCIGAYQFMLAAFAYGVGTCWMADMDTADVKRLVDIPDDHYLVTVTPIGFPVGEIPEAPERYDLSWYRRES